MDKPVLEFPAEKRECGYTSLFRPIWAEVTISVLEDERKLFLTKDGIVTPFLGKDLRKVEALASLGDKSFIVELNAKRYSLVLSLADEDSRQALVAAVANIIAGPAAGSGLEGLQDTDTDLTSSVANLLTAVDPGNVLASGSCFLETAGATAKVLFDSLVPGLLEVVRDSVPFLGPIAGVLLKCHNSLKTMTANQGALGDLQEWLKQAANIVVLISDKKELFKSASDGLEPVVESIKKLALAVHFTNLVIDELEAQQKKITGKIASFVLSKQHQELIALTLYKLRFAIDGFCQELQIYTSLESLGQLKQLAGAVDQVDAKVDQVLALLEGRSRLDRLAELLAA